MLPFLLRRKARPQAVMVDALAVSNVRGLVVVTPARVAEVAREALDTHGGHEGVLATLNRHLADDPDGTRKRIHWAREIAGALR